MPDALLAAPVVAEDLGAQRMSRTRIVEPFYRGEKTVIPMRRTKVRVVVDEERHLVGRPC